VQVLLDDKFHARVAELDSELASVRAAVADAADVIARQRAEYVRLLLLCASDRLIIARAACAGGNASRRAAAGRDAERADTGAN
jgi:hypothetical protein